MLVKLENPSLLAKAVEIISDLVTEVRIKINDSGLKIISMDPANVALVGFRIPKSAFTQFEVSNEILGVNLDSLKQILKRCGSSSSLVLERKENILEIQIHDRVKRNFTLALIEVESEDREIPNIEFSSKVELNSSDLINSIEDCAVIGDACDFKIKDNNFIIESKSLNSARSEFNGDEAKIEAENCVSRYSIEYLQKFLKASKLNDKTSLKFAEESPLRIDVIKPEIEFIFILAPRQIIED